jgi:lipoate-protein ligase B
LTRIVHLLGHSDYGAVHDLQRRLLAARIDGQIPDVILLLEHASVITVGRARSATANVLDPGDIPVVSVERGGDVTWHGPGQLVAYPIVALEGKRADLHLHMRSLEQAVIDLLGEHRLKPLRDDRNTGVWLPQPEGLPQKVCSVGIACRRWVTWHGLALNVVPELMGFHAIQPCGFDPDIVTRLGDHLNPPPSVQALAAPLAAHLCTSLELTRDGAIRYADSPEQIPALVGL